jgi:hypothetical protein
LFVSALQLKHLGEGAQVEGRPENEADVSDIMRLSSSRPGSFVRQEMTNIRSIVRSESSLFQLPLEEDDQYYFDAEESNTDELDWKGESSVRDANREAVVDCHLLWDIDRICPAWIEVCSNRSGYSKVYTIIRDGQMTLRLAQECEDLIQDSTWVKQTIDESFSPRLSACERTRRALGLNKHETDVAFPRMDTFLSQDNNCDEIFLRRPEPKNPDMGRVTVRAASFVARAISDRHWIEEWALVTARGISFYHPDKRSSHFRVSASSFTNVSKLPPAECPAIPNHYFLAVSTLGRTVYLMFSESDRRDEWVDAIRDVVTLAETDGNSVSRMLSEVDNPAEEFLHKSSMWSCRNRRLLNCASFSLCCGGCVGQSDPLELVETALRQALQLSVESMQGSSQRRKFLVSAAMLKDANVQSLSEDKKVVFFLNLYHVLILHAYLVLGPPDSSLKWISYFNNVAYQVADDIFSLSELEHCIIRAPMTSPTQFLSRFVIPKSSYSFALTRPDYRYNFAMNCGAMSNPETIQIYSADRLHDQLDTATRLYLLSSVVVQKRTRGLVVQLPRICQWFRADFGASDEALLKRIHAHLPLAEREALADYWLPMEGRFDTKSVAIRFLPYQFECRPLRLHQIEDLVADGTAADLDVA